VKINVTPKTNESADETAWRRSLAAQVNGLSEGRASALYQSAQSAPTTGTWALGDFVNNANPSELGAATAKYVIVGWQCLVAGTPGTWVQRRAPTGN
jgi:hypothetical protein